MPWPCTEVDAEGVLSMASAILPHWSAGPSPQLTRLLHPPLREAFGVA